MCKRNIKFVRFFCIKCGKEIWENLGKFSNTFRCDVEASSAVCSDCLLNEVRGITGKTTSYGQYYLYAKGEYGFSNDMIEDLQIICKHQTGTEFPRDVDILRILIHAVQEYGVDDNFYEAFIVDNASNNCRQTILNILNKMALHEVALPEKNDSIQFYSK